MKIVIIDTASSMQLPSGSRAVSSALQTKGHQTRMIFLPLRDLWEKSYLISAKGLDSLVEVVRAEAPDLIGVGVMSTCLERAVQVTNVLNNNFNLPIVWGGMHATMFPENSIQYTSILCLGEAEESMVELVHKLEHNQEYRNLDGFWFKDNGKIIKNRFRQPPDNLDNLPFPDLEIKNHYILKEEVVKMNESDLRQHVTASWLGLPEFYAIHAMRGCPGNCSFCHNSFVKEKYGPTKLRFRNIESIAQEIKTVKARFPFFKSIRFTDDDFFIRPLAEIKKFVRAYKEKCLLPFSCHCHPNTLVEEKLNLLIHGGLSRLTMGIQSGSDRTNQQVYARNTSSAQITEKIALLNRCQRKGIMPVYDFIIDNPFETNDDIIRTINLVSKISRRSIVYFFPLIIPPDSRMYWEAVERGYLTKNVDRKRFLRPTESSFGEALSTKRNYLTYILILKVKKLYILRLLTSNFLVKLFDSLPKPWLTFLFGRCLAPFTRKLRKKP